MKVIVQSLAIEYEDEGIRAGRTILFLHGWKNDLHTFDSIAAELSSSYRIVRLDLPGFGSSEMPPTDWNINDYVDFVDAFAKKLNIQFDVLVGHSLGGRIIIKGLATGSFHSQKAVLIASAGIAKRKSLRNGVMMLIAKTGKAIMAIPPLSFARENLRKKLYKTLGSDYGMAGALRQTFLNVVREDLSESARVISVPTLLIWGDRDTETPLIDGKRLLRLIPHSKLEIISGTGHFVHREKPKEVAGMIKEFLAS